MANAFSLGESQVKELKKQIVLEVKNEYPSAAEAKVIDIFDTALKNLLMTEVETAIDVRIQNVIGPITT